MVNVNTLIKILSIPGIGMATAKKLRAAWELTTDTELLDYVHEQNLKIRSLKLTPEIISLGIEKGNVIISNSLKAGISFLDLSCATYPLLLKQVNNPPLLLCYKGNSKLLDTNCLAVVGTRTPTKEGLKAGYCYGKFLGERGLTIVSGLAKGCDSAAHTGCLDGNGKTIAVVANGLDSVYPIENKKLVQRILDKGGLILSKVFIGEKANAGTLLDRNKIQVGLCNKVIIVEAGLWSGTTYTADLALKNQRKTGCLTMDNEYRPGNLKLLEKPCITPIKNKDDLLGFI